jgi:hypothetical protein
MSVPDLYCFPKAHESRYADGMLVLLLTVRYKYPYLSTNDAKYYDLVKENHDGL